NRRSHLRICVPRRKLRARRHPARGTIGGTAIEHFTLQTSHFTLIDQLMIGIQLMTERHPRRFIFLIALILTGLASIPMVPSAQMQGAPTVLIGGTVIDGNGGSPIADAAIVIAGTRIEAVGPRAAVSIP